MVVDDTVAQSRAVDSLLNFETVKYFGAEDREARRYGAAMTAYAKAAVRSENSLAWLNVGQAAITNLMLGGGMAFVRQIAHILDSLPCNLGYLWPLWDQKRQTFADKVLSTVVLDQPKQG